MPTGAERRALREFAFRSVLDVRTGLTAWREAVDKFAVRAAALANEIEEDGALLERDIRSWFATCQVQPDAVAIAEPDPSGVSLLTLNIVEVEVTSAIRAPKFASLAELALTLDLFLPQEIAAVRLFRVTDIGSHSEFDLLAHAMAMLRAEGEAEQRLAAGGVA